MGAFPCSELLKNSRCFGILVRNSGCFGAFRKGKADNMLDTIQKHLCKGREGGCKKAAYYQKVSGICRRYRASAWIIRVGEGFLVKVHPIRLPIITPPS